MVAVRWPYPSGEGICREKPERTLALSLLREKKKRRNEDAGPSGQPFRVFKYPLPNDAVLGEGVQSAYWGMLDEGRISLSTANILMQSVDEPIDVASHEPLCDWKGLKSYVHFPNYYKFLQTTHRIAQRQLHEFIVDSVVASTVISESEAEGEEARKFLEYVRTTFPQVLRVVKTRQVTYSVLNHVMDYLQNLEKVGLLEEKEMLHLHDAVQTDLKKLLRNPPLVKIQKINYLISAHPLLGSLPSTVLLPSTVHEKLRNCHKRSKRSQIRVGAMAADEGKVKIEKFDGADFGFWKMQIEDFLYQKNLYQPKEKTTAGLMAALSSMYEKPSASNKVHLMRRIFNLRMAEGASMAQYLNELNTITTQLSSVEIEFDDEVRALILLSSLPDSWNATITAVSSSSGNNKLKFDDVRDLGHFKRDCRAPKKNTGVQESANVTEETGDAMILSVNSPIESWILDLGVSFHSTPCREIMENYVSGDFGRVHLVDDETLKIVGKGDIRLKLSNQTTWTLKGVRHIPGLKRNLISVGQLDGEGYNTTFLGCEWKITKGALVIARGKKTGTLYVTSNLGNNIAAADADGKSNLWHQRLGHMSEKGMKTLLSKGKLTDLKNVDVGLCEDCIFSKQKKVSFAKIGKTPKAEKLELVHTNVCRLSPIPSLAGSLYYVTFIDDSTRKVWVYFLKKKSEFFDTFRKWKVMVENEIGLKVKRLRSDNGGEYKNKRFRNFCANNGIKMETTVPMTPQQNGVAERMNRTLNERARSMRIHVGLPKFLWAEAINTAAYLINYSAERSKLDAKSNKCVFVGYGGDEFESSSSNTEDETKEFAEFEEIFGNDVQISPEAVQEEPGTPELRRSSRIPKPTQRYSPSLHYLLLTNNGEPECYDEAMQVEDSVKWESFKKDEMDSLISNQTWELAELPPGKKALLRCKDSFPSWRFGGRNLYEVAIRLHRGRQEKPGSDMQEIINLKQKFSKQFAMKDLGAAKQILGVHFRLCKKQSPKTEEERAHMVKVPYTSAIGSLMYTMVCTRPDISQAVRVVSRYMNNPGKVHWEVVKWILIYLRGTTNKTFYFKGGDTILTGYVDVDLAKNVDIRMSTTGAIVLAKLLVPQIFEKMALPDLRALVAERSSMKIYITGETIEVSHQSVGFLLEGFIKTLRVQEELVASPAVLLPSQGNQTFVNANKSGDIIVVLCK
ncbi:Endomembrane protein 70 protein family isoform 1 [Hibiscus syriacus]|uniref:Endomembrane protein 70 protein family isoform 1 n=1 Tax=Hibiscus syriacus TaxID=106335 RepID=A0A6A3APX2_HIBSY|nr:Endomembrane protein 70 protein family isoform 1 [Hibiscus syriacus]